MAPGGGAGMFIVGFMEGLNNGGEIWWGGLTGVGHGAAMIANAVTLHQIDSLDSYVDGLIEQNGGSGSLYWCADWSANIGVGAAALAGGIYAAGIISAWEAAITLPTIGWNVIMTGGGTCSTVLGVTGTTTITITGVQVLQAGLFGTLIYAIGRAKAVERATELGNRINEHLQYIKNEPGSQAVGHWRTEIRGWINQIDNLVRHMGKKTGNEWTEIIARWRQLLGE